MINNSQNSVPDRCVCARVLCSFVLPFLSFFSLLSVFLCPFIFTRRSLFTSKWPWSCSNIYIRKEGRERECKQAVISFFSISFRVTVHSYICICILACDQCMDITSHTNTHTYIYIIKRKEAKLRPEQKTCSNFSFSFPLLFLFYIENNDHNLSLSLFLTSLSDRLIEQKNITTKSYDLV